MIATVQTKSNSKLGQQDLQQYSSIMAGKGGNYPMPTF